MIHMKTDSDLIDELGGPTVVAGLCEVTPSAVSQWRQNGIPKPWRKYLSEVFPDAFVGCQPTMLAIEKAAA